MASPELKFSHRLEPVLTLLAKACLEKRPDNIQRFCFELLADRLQAKFRYVRDGGSRDKLDYQLDELDNDDEDIVLRSRTKDRALRQEERGEYHSSDDCSQDSNDEVSGEHVGKLTTVKSVAFEDHSTSAPDDSMFSTAGLTQEELEQEVVKCLSDERMKKLFDAWDGDSSGTIDLVELCVELHKFDEVATKGNDIQIASQALVQCVNVVNGAIQLQEFTKVMILFCRNIFKCNFDDVAGHLLNVATYTSEEAARQAASGKDVRDIEAADKEEEEFLRETVKGIEDHVNDNIRKLRSARVRHTKTTTSGGH